MMLHIFGALFVSPLRVLHHFPQTLLLLRLVELLRGLTITVRAESKAQLDAVYMELTSCRQVLVAL